MISPILSFVYALKRFRNRNYHVIILLFAFLFGYSFIPYENSDTERYKHYYEIVTQFSLNEYIQEISLTYSGGATFPDIYLPSLMFITSVFGASFKVFIGVQAVIYFDFFLGILNTILDQVKNAEYKKYIVFFLGCVFIYSFSSGINGIRFPTAFMVFMYFTLKYLFNPKLIYIILVGLSCLIHIALLQAYLGFICFIAINKINNKYLKTLIIVGFVGLLYSLNIQETTQLINNDIISQKVQDYTNENYIEQREAHTKKWNWYIQFNQYSNFYFLIGMVFLSMFKFKANPIVKRLFLITLVFLIISMFNELYLDPISNRYREFFEFFALIYLIILFAFSPASRFKNIANKIYSVILLITILIQLRSLSYNLDFIRLSISPVINLFEFDSVNIYHFL